jgi:hypothetical protein
MSHDICITPVEIPGVYGEPPVMVDPARLCDECGHVHEFEKCPKCGSWISPYMIGANYLMVQCLNDKCDWTHKTVYED